MAPVRGAPSLSGVRPRRCAFCMDDGDDADDAARHTRGEPGEGGGEVRERARAQVLQLGLSAAELAHLFTAADPTAYSRNAQAYHAWLDGEPATRGIAPSRLLALLEQRRRRGAEGAEF